MNEHTFIELSQARVLISNDDGINAHGIEVLTHAVLPIAREVWVVAPETEQSAVAHSLTLRRPLKIRRIEERRYAVDGTPTDCVLLAVNEIMADNPPDIILSGVNHGYNIGEDVTYSGTVAAAIEGLIMGVPSIAFSQDIADGNDIHWSTASHWIIKVLQKLVGFTIPNNTLLNVNFPNVTAQNVTGMEITRQGEHKSGDEILRGKDPKGNPYYWIGSQFLKENPPQGTDLHAINNNAVSITPLSIDLTNREVLEALKKTFQ